MSGFISSSSKCHLQVMTQSRCRCAPGDDQNFAEVVNALVYNASQKNFLFKAVGEDNV